MPGPFAIDEAQDDSWSLQGQFGSFVYPAAIGLAGWGARRGAVSMARGGGFWSGVFGGGAYNKQAYEAAEGLFTAAASRTGIHSAQAGRAFIGGATRGMPRTTLGAIPVNPSAVAKGNVSAAAASVGGTVSSVASKAGGGPVGPSIAKSNTAARIFKAGKIGQGAMRMLNMYLMANIAIDIGEAATSAALAYRPRSSASPASEFGTFNPLDSSGAYTMRQRSISAIHDSYLSTRAAIGNEASFMHR